MSHLLRHAVHVDFDVRVGLPPGRETLLKGVLGGDLRRSTSAGDQAYTLGTSQAAHYHERHPEGAGAGEREREHLPFPSCGHALTDSGCGCDP